MLAKATTKRSLESFSDTTHYFIHNFQFTFFPVLVFSSISFVVAFWLFDYAALVEVMMTMQCWLRPVATSSYNGNYINEWLIKSFITCRAESMRPGVTRYTGSSTTACGSREAWGSEVSRSSWRSRLSWESRTSRSCPTYLTHLTARPSESYSTGPS